MKTFFLMLAAVAAITGCGALYVSICHFPDPDKTESTFWLVAAIFMRTTSLDLAERAEKFR